MMKFSFVELDMIREAITAHAETQTGWINAHGSTPNERALARTKLIVINRIMDKFNDDE